jgi:hypothetical protein
VKRVWTVAIVAVGVAVATASMTAPVADAGTFTVGRLLNELPVRRERNAGYDRDRFVHWQDRDHDGCDTRAEVLIQESRRPVTRTASCTVLRGRWFSSYDGATIVRARRLHLDHVVALSEAWGSGARRWDTDTRDRFANDLVSAARCEPCRRAQTSLRAMPTRPTGCRHGRRAVDSSATGSP